MQGPRKLTFASSLATVSAHMTPREVAKQLLRFARHIRRDTTLRASARLVAEDILDRIDWKLGYKDVSQEFLGKQLGLDVRTVRQATK